MEKDKGGRPRAFEGEDTKRLGIVLPVSMCKKVQHAAIESEEYPTMSELIHAALVEYFEKRDKGKTV